MIEDTNFIFQIGPLISGISLAAGSIIAGLTLVFYYRKVLNDAEIERFRLMYAEFWQNDHMSEIRKWILNDTIYSDIEPVFMVRNSMQKCNVSREEHEILEQFDRFCALMVRIKSISNRSFKNKQKKLWGKLLNGDFWISRINQRKEMKIYIKNHWSELD